MIISLIGQEKNLGLLTLTDYLIDKLGKNNIGVVGWNYLVSDYSTILESIDSYGKNNKSVIIKYAMPRIKFSNQAVEYPKEINTLSDVVFRVPSYKEELMPTVPLTFFKGEDNPIVKHIKDFYK